MALGGTDGTTSPVPSDNRREDMLRAALHVIAERGFSDTRIVDVAVRAGVSAALVIYYFQTKDNLLTEAVRLAEDRWFAEEAVRLSAIPDVRKRLEEIVHWACSTEPDDEFPDPWSLWIDLWARAQRHDEVARVREEFDGRWRSAIATIVADGQASGTFDAVDADAFAIAFMALLDGLSVQLALRDPAVDEGFVQRVAMGYAADSLGFTWDGGPPPPVPPGTGTGS